MSRSSITVPFVTCGFQSEAQQSSPLTLEWTPQTEGFLCDSPPDIAAGALKVFVYHDGMHRISKAAEVFDPGCSDLVDPESFDKLPATDKQKLGALMWLCKELAVTPNRVSEAIETHKNALLKLASESGTSLLPDFLLEKKVPLFSSLGRLTLKWSKQQEAFEKELSRMMAHFDMRDKGTLTAHYAAYNTLLTDIGKIKDKDQQRSALAAYCLFRTSNQSVCWRSSEDYSPSSAA